MPKRIERRLRKTARRKLAQGTLKTKDVDAYVYGTMKKMGWRPSSERT